MILRYLFATTLTVVGAFAATLTAASTDVPKSILDNNPAGVTSVLTGPALVNITDVNLILTIEHTSVSDLHLTLTSPAGTNIVLLRAFSEGGILVGLGTPVNFTNTKFDDQAPTGLRDGTAPFTGSFNINHSSVVSNPLSGFNGQTAAGVWTLFISDLAGADSGRLVSWSLEITGSEVPEPSSWASLGLGLAALAALRSRVRG